VTSDALLYGPYVLATALAIAALIVRARDLASTTQFRIMLGGAGLLALGWTGFLVALARSDL
jgi:hypothetical protein